MEIHPALLVNDLQTLLKELGALEELNPHYDIDIIDWTRTSSRTLSVNEALQAKTGCDLTFDLMMNYPASAVRELVEDPRVKAIILNLESSDSLVPLIDLIHFHGKKAGLAINPDDHFFKLVPYLPELDIVQIFTVEPGAQGNPFLKERLELAKELRQFGFTEKICYDGGINEKTMTEIFKYPVNILSIGSMLSRAADPVATYRHLEEVIKSL